MIKPYNRAEVSFQLQTEIGHEGANSKVWLAHDAQLDAQVVLKVIAKSTLDVDTYFEESKILHLSNHPNVVPVHYSCQDTDSVYIAMPYFSRGSLKQLMESRHLTVREIVVLGCQISSGLHNVHSKKLMHFDVKPDNVLLSARGEALLSDFGLARRLMASGTASQDRWYLKMQPPECWGASEFHPTFDIYQLGLTLYRMCVGDEVFYRKFDTYGPITAFDRDAFKFDVRNGRFPERDVFPEHIPDRLKRLVKKCLEPNPVDRFQAVMDVSNELAQVDTKFDWQFERDATSRTWKKADSDKEYRIVVDNAGASLAQKTMLRTGNTTRVASYCLPSITSQQIKRFLGEV